MSEEQAIYKLKKSIETFVFGDCGLTPESWKVFTQSIDLAFEQENKYFQKSTAEFDGFNLVIHLNKVGFSKLNPHLIDVIKEKYNNLFDVQLKESPDSRGRKRKAEKSKTYSCVLSPELLEKVNEYAEKNYLPSTSKAITNIVVRFFSELQES